VAYFAVLYHVVDDFVAKRARFRDEHLILARAAHQRGELVLAGALADPADRALLVFRADDKTQVERFVNEDPYVRNGLVPKVEIRPWTVVIPSQDSLR
jgi:uncharacterized protein YciI